MKRVLLMAVLSISSFSTAAAAETSTAAVAENMTKAATQFLAALSPGERQKVERAFDDPARQDWHNIPKPTRKGLQVRDMSVEQRKLCHELLQSALSADGYAKAVKIMSLESNLKVGEKGTGPLRDPQRFFLTFFGKPDLKGPWGWSFEGHHLSLNFVIRDGRVVADSPNFWGANPATVHTFVTGGPDEGTRTLANEEQLALDLVNSFTPAQRSKAVIAPKSPADYRAAGQPAPPKRVAEGLPATELTGQQQQALLALLATYCEHLAPALAQERLAEIKADGWDQVYFAWKGGTKPGVGHYYRVEGPSFILELVNVQTDPAGNPANHIHSVWRNPKGDFGVVRN
ncbi:MAG TPA: DUF3500 domain-containing protein [Planctomycetaceae bacterium]|nr:DUF3500 domain-containing protein [Planctomycetaceae bacterium]